MLTSSAAFGDRSYDAKTVTRSDRFSSSSSGGASDETDATDSLKLDTTAPVSGRISSVYAATTTSSWKVMTTPAITTAAATALSSSHSTGAMTAMTRFSGSSADVISLTQPETATTTAAAATETALSSWRQPSISAWATTTRRQFSADADARSAAPTGNPSRSPLPSGVARFKNVRWTTG